MVGQEHLERCVELKASGFSGHATLLGNWGNAWWSRGLVLLSCLISWSACSDVAPVSPVPAHPEQVLQVPNGFEVSVFARLEPAGSDYFRGPRFMAFGPDGHLYLSLGFDRRVVMLPDRNHDGRADEVVLVSDKLDAPQGLVFANGDLLVANQNAVVRLDQKDGRWPATSATTLIPNLPTGGHTLKSLRLGPDGYLYLNIGSSCNACVESDPLRATISRYTVDGRPAGAVASVGRHPTSPIWATGLRNSQGLAWHPETGEMYATNDGSDMRTEKRGTPANDEVPPEHLNQIRSGQHYGWPACWGNRFEDPEFSGYGGCSGMTSPAITFPSHSTPIGITFLDKTAFPPEYRGDALVALHGSWNRAVPSGYKVVRVRFEQGKPVGVTDFVTGWLKDGKAWGRPVDVASGPDGAIYVSDDRAGMIYRITYRKEH